MLLLIVRHARAGASDPAKYPDDSLRPLTREGREIHAEVSAALRKRGLRPDLIIASPWKRAWQTALIMAKEFSTKKNRIKPKTAPSLAAAPDLDAIRAELEGVGEVATVALVGHEPWLGELASLLLAGEANRVSIDFPKSGVLGIETASLESGKGVLRFLLRPRLLEG